MAVIIIPKMCYCCHYLLMIVVNIEMAVTIIPENLLLLLFIDDCCVDGNGCYNNT